MTVMNPVVMNILNCRLIGALKSPRFITLLENLKDVPTIRPQVQSLIYMNRQSELGMAIQKDRWTGGKLDYLMTVSSLRLMET